MEEAITINCQKLRLEGRLASASATNCAVITHPHPLFGGNMDNPVVMAVADAYRLKGWSTLRFNFRGTGHSEGRFDNGKGEQRDIGAAIAHLKADGYQSIDLAGYSFGAWVLACWSREHPDHPHTIRLVAPPVAFIDFADIQSIPGLDQVIVGSRDEIAPATLVESLIHAWQPRAEFNIVPQADHFFGGHLQTLQAVIKKNL